MGHLPWAVATAWVLLSLVMAAEAETPDQQVSPSSPAGASVGASAGVTRCGCCLLPQVFSTPLDSSGESTLYWSVDYARRSLDVEVHFVRAASSHAWFAVGFSDYGEACPADYCVLWQDWRGRSALQDTWAASDGRLQVDESQDCDGFRHTASGNVTKFAFRRKFDTCDPNDYVIEVSP